MRYLRSGWPGAGVWATLGLMSVSALCGAITDLNFNGKGYAWQLLNCLLTAAYALTLRGIMDKVFRPAVRRARWTLHVLSCAAACSMQQTRYEKYRRHQVDLMHTPAHAFRTCNNQKGPLAGLQVAPMTRNQQKLGEYSMVLYNNVLSLPLLLLAAGINGEYTTILQVWLLQRTLSTLGCHQLL